MAIDVPPAFTGYQPALRRKLLALRRLILDVAAQTEGVGPLQETLKWGQPSYVTTKSGSGTTVRIDAVKGDPRRYALYVNCQTDLVDTYRGLYSGELEFGGNRSILFDVDKPLAEPAVRHCIALALTYHLAKAKRRQR